MRVLAIVALVVCSVAQAGAQPKFNTTFPKTLHILDAGLYPIKFKAGWGYSGSFKPLPKNFILVKTIPPILDDTAWIVSEQTLTYEVHWSGLPLGADSLTVPVTLTDPASGQSRERTVFVYGRRFPRRLR